MNKTSSREFPVAPPGRGAWLSLLSIPLVMVVGGLLLPYAEPDPSPALLLAPVIGLLVAVALVLALRRRRIELHDGELKVASTFYTRSVPVQALDLDKARVVDLAEHTEYKPGMKSNGFNLIGFQSGHYRLRNKAKAFCLVSDSQRVLVLPQKDGQYLLLSPEKPHPLLEALRAQAA